MLTLTNLWEFVKKLKISCSKTYFKVYGTLINFLNTWDSKYLIFSTVQTLHTAE